MIKKGEKTAGGKEGGDGRWTEKKKTENGKWKRAVATSTHEQEEEFSVTHVFFFST